MDCIRENDEFLADNEQPSGELTRQDEQVHRTQKSASLHCYRDIEEV
jgi:hypothetical protein